MITFLLRPVVFLLDLLLGGSQEVEPRPQDVTTSVERWADPYFAAFLDSCLRWVYGEKTP